MKVSGFTILRNGSKFDYPYQESLRSLLPLVDELVVAVGKSDDDTMEQIQALAAQEAPEKFKIIKTIWDLDNPDKRKGGLILSEQTNLALEHCTGDWCFYLQADEVLHEADYAALRHALAAASADSAIDGLLFDYVHLYGSYDVIQDSRSAYRREVRAFKRSSRALSVGDAQSFRKPDGSKLSVVRANARVFHYGWVRSPEAMKDKTFFMDQLYHGKASTDEETSKTPYTGDNYRYKKFWGLKPFQGTHPLVMHARIAAKGWHWDIKNSRLVWSHKDVKKILLDSFERITGIRLFEYRSYIVKTHRRNP